MTEPRCASKMVDIPSYGIRRFHRPFDSNLEEVPAARVGGIWYNIFGQGFVMSESISQ